MRAVTGPALLLTAQHADPHVAAREARRRLGAEGADDEALVTAVVAEGFSERVASEAVAVLPDREGTVPTGTCAGGPDPSASDD